MKTAWAWIGAVGLLAGTAQAAGPVRVKIAWDYRDIATKMEVYETKGHPRLWETKAVKTATELPIAKEIDRSAFDLVPGQKKRFVLTMHNDTDKALYFFAAPHQVHPVEHSLGFKFKCLCVNHAFTVAPKETWYRVVEFHLSDGFVGNELTISHTIIGIDDKRAKEFSKPTGVPDM